VATGAAQAEILANSAQSITDIRRDIVEPVAAVLVDAEGGQMSLVWDL
jgi:hypothetical protein